jgi:hypothetical protein
MNLIYDPWPWYVAGPLISLTMFILLFAGKKFGMSSNLSTMCSIGGAGKFADHFKFDWKSHRWNLIVVLGAIIGGYIASHFMSDNTVLINTEVAQQLSQDYGITSVGQAYLPPELFATQQLTDPFVLAILILSGFMVGFGSRYAGGCTSGHAISGLSNLQLPSLIAVIGFFIGGLVMIHLLFPLIFG